MPKFATPLDLVVTADEAPSIEHSPFRGYYERPARVSAIRQALAHNADGGNLRGASTISQQVAKNLFLWSGRSWLRKGLEAWFTALIELLWSKERILEVYLNSVEWGDGVFGAEAAAQHYFRKPAARLTPGEAARLAVMLPRPKYFEKLPQSGYLANRSATIVARMGQVAVP